MSNTPNTIAVLVSFVPATNTRGSRVKVEIPRMRIKNTFCYDHKFNSVADQVESYLHDIEAAPIAASELPKATVFLVGFNHWEALQNCFGKVY